MKRAIIHTLGCKVNQCESDALRSLLASAGFDTGWHHPSADVVVINTCTVTGKAAMQSRQAIRRALRNHPNARIVVTGCYAQTAPDEIQAIEGVHLVVGHADKLRIADLLSREKPHRHETAMIHQPIHAHRAFDALPSVAPDNRTRAFLKIQDGCNARCTYCIVPYARGQSRSMPEADVLSHLHALGSQGYREVVLTGIHLGAYGKDFDPPLSLANLISGILPKCPVDRLRLSSIEPTEIDDGILQQMASLPSRLCAHLHIPLQSGNDRILARMGRPYTREFFAQVIQHVKDLLPHAAIGADVLVGFPGESDSAFEQTFALIEALPLSYLHVFPFSSRNGTPAAQYRDTVAAPMIKERCSRLRQLGQRKKEIFYRSQVGRMCDILVETLCDAETGLPKGHTANYLPVVIKEASSEIETNTIVPVRIERLDDQGRLIGRYQPHC